MCVNCLHSRGTWVRGVSRHLLNLGSGQGLHSYSPCSITDHGTLYNAAHGPRQQLHLLDHHRVSRQFRHNDHHSSLYPLQEEVLRAEFRQDQASVLKGPHCQMTMGSEGWLGHGKAEGLLMLKGFSQVP